MTFVPLRVHSHGSLLHGTASPEALIARALELGYPALALCDRDNLYLAIRFFQAARADGLTPLLGATVTSGAHEALLIPIDRRGYAHLCRILTHRRLDDAFDLIALMAEPAAEPLAAGLHVIVESPGFAAALAAAGVPPAHGDAGPAPGGRADTGRRTAHAGGLWMGVRGLASERVRLGERVAMARWLGVPLVATGDCTMLAATDHDTHRVAVTAAAGELLERMPPGEFCAREAWLASPAEWERRVRAVCAGAGLLAVAGEALAHNHELVARCRLDLDLGTPIFPRAPLPDGVAGCVHLRGQCEAGLVRRYPRERDAARARLANELAMIERMGFTDYFLLVAEIVGFARARGIPTVGRGSGASSIVAYVLGITNVDPLRYGLTFERFLNPARRDCPDLDIDLCWRRRDDVIAHVYDTYGKGRVAMISTHATLGARSAFRETAKALGVPNARVNALAKRIPRDLEKPYPRHLARVAEAGAVDWSEPVLARALALAERLDGAPRHLSVHSGGIVIGDRELTHYVPLERAAKQIIVTQFEMRAIEAIGLVKMDLLGNRALSTIGECLELIEQGSPGGAPDLEDIDGDPATAARIRVGDTLDCFQLESPAMRHLVRMLDARSLDDTIAAVALVRPGPAESGMKEVFCRRRRGLEPPSYLHPSLVPVLECTYGVMLYEEDVMRVAAALTGLSLAEGDDLRRAIGAARTDDEFRSLEQGFVAQAARAGVDADSARRVWRELTRFAAYAFCKAHAAGYGALGYQCAYLKEHHPTEFAVAILNHHAGMYATWVHVEDLRRQGVVFRAPCAQRSAWDTTLERRGDTRGANGCVTRRAGDRDFTEDTARPAPRKDGRPNAVRVGLGRVFGLAEATGRRIVAARATRPFRSLADFTERVRPTLPELEALVLAGALDWTGRTRPSLLLEARAGSKAWSRAPAHAMTALVHAGASVDPEPIAPVAVPELPEFGAAAHLRGEVRATGLWFGPHPLELLAPASERAGTVPAARLADCVGHAVAVVGLPCAYRGVETKSGERMLFLTLADQTGLAECVLFPQIHRAFAGAARSRIVRVEGRVDESLGAITVVAERVRAVRLSS
jgi:DNA-directed DNA polymerase III PolC